jgi:DNA-binding transcriptional MerR regulator
MRLAELSRRSGLSRSTIKFYIREGLLPSGDQQARNQAEYGPRHVERLALITALREVGSVPLGVIARVVKELEAGWTDGGDPIGEALRAIHTPPRSNCDPVERDQVAAEVREILRTLPWTIDGKSHFFTEELTETLLLVRRYLYPNYPVTLLAPLARVAWLLSEVEFENAPGGARVPIRARGDDLAEPTRRAILGSILFERVFGALRRCANSMRSIRISEGFEVPAADSPNAPIESQGAE